MTASTKQSFLLNISSVYGLAYHRLGNFADAQDITQDVFIEVYQNLERLERPAKFASWLRGITINLCRMWQRKKRPLHLSPEEELALPSDEPSALDVFLIDTSFPDFLAATLGNEVSERQRGAR